MQLKRRMTRLTALLLMALWVTTPAAAFEVSEMSTRLVDGTWYLDAYVNYEFSDTALDALENGVPLILDVKVEILRERPWLWKERVLKRRLRYLIRYHALASLYQIENLGSGTRLNFATRDAAIRTLGEVLELPLIEDAALKRGAAHEIRMRAKLDIESLPLPLRPLAYLSPAWHLSSGWKSWRMQP